MLKQATKTQTVTPTLVVETEVVGDALVTWYKGFEHCRDTPMLFGFQTSNKVGFVTASLIVEELELPLIADVTSKTFPPMCVLSRWGPSAGLRVFGNSRMSVVVCEFPIEGGLAYDVERPLKYLANRLQSSSLVFMEGLQEKIGLSPGMPVPSNEQEMMQILKSKMESEDLQSKPCSFYSSCDKLSDALVASGHKFLENAVVSGITGLMLLGTAAEQSATPATCIFVPFSPIYPETRAALKAVSIIRTLFPELTMVETGELESVASQMEKKLREAVNEMAFAKACPSSHMYS